jgi:uncharacterized protein YraI
MSGKKLFSSAIVIGSVLFGNLVISAPSQAASVCTNRGGNVNVRTGPGTRYRIAYSVSSGQYIQVLGRSGTWYRVPGGYIRADFVCG